MTDKLRRFLLSLLVAASCSGAPLAYAQTPTQDCTRGKIAADSIVRVSTSSRVDRLAKELKAIVERRSCPVPAPAPAPPPAPTPAPPPPPMSAPGMPGAPVLTITGSTVTVSWSAASGAASYSYAAGRSSGGAWPNQSGVVLGLNVALTVPAGVAFWVCVQAVNPAGTSNPACNSGAVPGTVVPPVDTIVPPSDTVTPPPPPPSGSGCVNRPAGMTTLSEVDFSQNIPAPNGNQSAVIVGGGGWDIPFSSVEHLTQVTDNDPISPGSAWRIDFPAGSYGGGVVGAGGGTGFGDFGFPLGTIRGWNREVYACVAIKWDATFEWHPISNKWFELDSQGLQLLIQSHENGGGNVLQPETTTPGWRAPASDAPVALGVWHVVEIFVGYGAGSGVARVWLDGVTRANASGLTIPGTSGWQDMYFRNFRGGGGEVKSRTSQMWYGHIVTAGR